MRTILVMSLCALALPSARAQSITEAGFLAGLGDEHVAARALKEGLGVAEAAETRARTLPNPRVEFWREAPDANPRVTNWTVAWIPPFDGRYRLGKESAEKGLAAARERFGLDRVALRLDARGSFAAWSLGYERVDVLRQQRDLVGRLARQQRERATVGEESGLAARRFALAADEVRAGLRETEAAYAMAEAAVRVWHPELAASAVPAPLHLPTVPDVATRDEVPQVRALAFELEQAGLDVRRTQRFWGFPTIQLGMQTIEDGSIHEDGPIFAAGWSVPLFDRDKAARVEAERRKEVTTARLEWAKSRIAAEIEGGIKAYELLRASAEEAREAARETDRIIEAATAAFRAGETGLTDLFETLRAALSAKLREIDARARALEAHRRLEAVLGRSLTTGDTR